MSKHQLKIAELQIPIGTIKKIMPNVSDKEKDVVRYEKLQLYLELGRS